jgi:hypothetical protein
MPTILGLLFLSLRGRALVSVRADLAMGKENMRVDVAMISIRH